MKTSYRRQPIHTTVSPSTLAFIQDRTQGHWKSQGQIIDWLVEGYLESIQDALNDTSD